MTNKYILLLSSVLLLAIYCIYSVELHPNPYNFIGLTKVQVICLLDENEKVSIHSIGNVFNIEIDGHNFYFANPSEAQKNKIVLEPDVWNVNYSARFSGFFTYRQTLRFKNDQVISQTTKIGSDCF